MVGKVLVTESLAQAGIDILKEACEVDTHLKPSAEELVQLIGDYDGLIVRSGTEVTEQVLLAGKRLKVVGRAGTGVDNIDLDAATRRGVVVVNAPTSNTIAVAEHTMALMLSVARHIPQADCGMHDGRWEKKALMGTELRHKILGLVGFGRVGEAVAARARAFEMRVIAYDPFVSPERASRSSVEMVGLEDLLSQADYVSLHAPSTERTRRMISTRAFDLMKPSAYLINCARGDLVSEHALVEALTHQRIAGAAIDVFVDEPYTDPVLCGCPNLVLTPHLGASTEEAQMGAAQQVARQVVDVIEGKPPRYPVNVASLTPEELGVLGPYLDLARRMGRFYAQFAENNLRLLEMTYAGDVAEHDTSLITAAALAALLSEAGQEHVNLVNARLVADERGLVVREIRTSEIEGFSGLVTFCTRTTSREHLLSGTVMRGQPHIVRIDNFWLDFVPEGSLLVEEHIDEPGVVGRMGTLLGNVGINISFVELGREIKGGRAAMVLGLDEALDEDLMEQIRSMPSICSAYAINL